MGTDLTVRAATQDDLGGIAAIYNHEVSHGISTFDLQPPPVTYWQDRLASTQDSDHLLVAVEADHVVGYAHSSSYRPRPAYAHTRETSIYLDPSARGRGIGRVLYPALLDEVAASGVHTVVALVALPNPSSVRLHRAVGFKPAGTMREVGYKFDRWIDIAWYDLLLSCWASNDAAGGPVRSRRRR